LPRDLKPFRFVTPRDLFTLGLHLAGSPFFQDNAVESGNLNRECELYSACAVEQFEARGQVVVRLHSSAPEMALIDSWRDLIP
jgi:hypothetical protein